MKVLFITLLLSTAIYGQACSVNQCSLTYNTKSKTMALIIPKSLMEANQNKNNIEVSVSNSFSLSINGKEKNAFFIYKGFKIENTWGFTYESNYTVTFKEDKKQYTFTFQSIEPNEYILKVSILEKNETYVKKTSNLIIK